MNENEVNVCKVFEVVVEVLLGFFVLCQSCRCCVMGFVVCLFCPVVCQLCLVVRLLSLFYQEGEPVTLGSLALSHAPRYRLPVSRGTQPGTC